MFQNRLSGSGNFSEAHTATNCAGHEATVGLNLGNASYYAYSYALSPGYVCISASESLYVDHAGSIDAYATARAPEGDTAGSEIHIQNGALHEYSNGASVVNGVLSTHQEFTKASGDTVYVKSWGLDYGRVQSNFQVDTNVTQGMIENYKGFSSMSDLVQLNQSSHITGQFVSRVPIKKELERTSNYGSQFDLESGFTANLSRIKHFDPVNNLCDRIIFAPEIYSHLVYYVDQADPNANRIQGAIDAAITGDGIRIAEGNYYENIDIKKSLSIQGAGAGRTIVNPADKISDDSIITVDKDAFVLLGGISLTNGHAREGGAIKNEGTLLLKDYEISHNVAKYGGGIYNAGTLVLGSGTVSNNDASQDGGGVYNKGDSVILGSNISSNGAKYGGGVYNLNGGSVYLKFGDIVDNQARENGGGVWNDGLFVMDAGNISYNQATKGGGVYNKKTLYLLTGNISSNTAVVGGGVRNDGSFAMYGGQINSNMANNGGAVFNKGSFTICNGTISHNKALNRGGAIYNDGGSIMLSGGDISYNQAQENGGIHSVYSFKKKGINGNKSIVHDNQNGNIGWHHNKKHLISVICGAIAAVILIAVLTALTVGVFMYIAAASTAATAAGISAAATTAALSAGKLATATTFVAATAAATAAATTAATAAAGAAALVTTIEVMAVIALIGLAALSADAIAWVLGIYFTK
jgi:hypothetical protein